MTNKVVKKSKRSRTSIYDNNLMRGTVRARSDKEIAEETLKPKIRCLNQCDLHNKEIESKLVENDAANIRKKKL